jgi:dienelactone hydrolase
MAIPGSGNGKRGSTAAAGVLAALVLLLAACSGPGQPASSGAAGKTGHTAAATTAGQAPASPAGVNAGSASPGATGRSGPSPRADPLGRLGTFAVGQRWLTLTEPAHTGVTGERLGPRRLLVSVFYPRAASGAATAAGAGHARRGLPMLVFAPGFMQCGTPYRDMLRSWATAGYVVVTVNFPESDCRVGSAATESDMVNQPGDMSYVITQLLARSAAAAGFFGGLIDPGRIAVTGQSDGGDTVAALAASTCCGDRRVRAIAVLSGAEWPPMPGRYFTRRPAPMLFVQGSADTVNPPGCSVVMYRADPARARYYLDLFGATHVQPYWGTNRYEKTVVRVTTAFFDRYLLGQAGGLAAMRADGTVPHLAAFHGDGGGAFPSTSCNT